MRPLPLALAGGSLAALVLATCFDPRYPTGIPCSERDTCPPGQTCQAGICQADPVAIDAGIPGDGRPVIDARTGCTRDEDCSGDDVCGPSGMCVAATCTDSARNGTETDVDCGGTCPRCADNAVCAGPGDCESGVCQDQRCQAPRCRDGVTNGGEQCDDGNDSNADDCTNACAAASCSDGFENADELDVDCAGHCGPGSCTIGQSCGDQDDCASGNCVDAVCAPPVGESCQAIHLAAPSAGDGLYFIDPDGASGALPFQVFCNMSAFGGGWTRCLEFVNTAAEDVNDNTWFDTCVDFTMASWTGAELMIELRDEAGTVLYSATGVRERDWTQNQLTSTASADQQYDINDHTPVILSNTDRMIIPGKDSANGGCAGSLGNGYGIVVYPSGATDPAAAKLMVMPYRHQVAGNSVRAFGAGNAQWFTNNEITFDGTTSWNTCGFPPGSLGSFSFYVR